MRAIAMPRAWFLLAACVLLGCEGTPTPTATSESSEVRNLGKSTTQKIAFSSTRDGDQDIYTMNPDGSDVTQLTNTGQDASPDWSPDASQLVFACGFDICVMDADGENARDITGSSLFEYSPAWSPDGSKIAFSGSFDGSSSGIYVMNTDGSDPVLLTSHTTLVFDRVPTWSPRGDEIAFVRNVTSGGSDPGISDLYIMKSDGSYPRKVTNSTSSEQVSSGPSWSPSHLIATSGADPNHPDFPDSEIFVMKPDGSRLRYLGTYPSADFDPSWSPNGREIAFWRYIPEESYFADIYVVSADGKNVRNLTPDTPNANDFDPDWSPR